MTPAEHYQAARQISLSLAAIAKLRPWCRVIRAEREVWKCATTLSRSFASEFPNMRNPYTEIPKDD